VGPQLFNGRQAVKNIRNIIRAAPTGNFGEQVGSTLRKCCRGQIAECTHNHYQPKSRTSYYCFHK
jgi:hypothetical protein